MIGFDLIQLSAENLGRRKGRVALTAVGVVIGTAAVVSLVSLGIGLQRNANQQFGNIGDLTSIQVYPQFEEAFYGPGAMVVEAGPGGKQPPKQKLITDETLAEIAALPGVTGVYPRDFIQGGYMISFGRLEGGASLVGVPPGALEAIGVTPAGGSLTLEKGTVIVGATVPQNFYDPRWRPGQEPPKPPELLDQTLKLTLMKWSPDGSETRRSVQMRVAGTLAEVRGESDWTIYMRLDEVESFNGWVTGRRVNRSRDGYPELRVKVDDVKQVLEVADQIIALGYQAYTPQEYVQGFNTFYVVLQVIFGGMGAIALLVAAIGIANTMTMAILERTREIGLMKAVGATNRDVLGVFLAEAAGIGLFGGVAGVALGWGVGQVVNVLALAYLAGQAVKMGGPPPAVAIYTPLWLPIFGVVFATLIGVLSGFYPALRAATLAPVTALKYE